MKSIPLLILLFLSTPITSLAQCGRDFFDFDANQINSKISVLGLWLDGEDAGFEYPKGSGIHASFIAGFWISGILDDTVRGAIQGYEGVDGRFDFSVGPIGSLNDPYFCSPFSVTKDQVNAHILDFADGILDQPIEAITSWPGRGNANGPAILATDQFAPFIDLNRNGIYEPTAGEYPDIRGDAASWWVANTNIASQVTGSSYWPAELHVLLQAYDTVQTSQLSRTQFYSVSLINRATTPLDSAALSFWTDFDLGCFTDDGFGTIPEHQLMYSYNLDAVDGTVDSTCDQNVASYGSNPPIFSMQILDAKTSSGTSEVEFRSSYFRYSPTGVLDPAFYYPRNGIPKQVYDVTHGRWRDGSPLTFGGGGLRGMTNTDWPFSGDPADTSSWSMSNLYGDYTGIFDTPLIHANASASLAPNERLLVNYAAYIVEGVSVPSPSTEKIKTTAIELKEFYLDEVSSIRTINTSAIKGMKVSPNPSSGAFRVVLPKERVLENLQAVDFTGKSVPLSWKQQTDIVNAELSTPGVYVLIASDTKGNLYRSRIVVE
ncbi:MAG: T9SS type A sorting domain-containing protein [Saprospiraceae bacterium]